MALRPDEHLLHAVGQRLVGEILVGEQRVAAVGRHLDAVEDGAHRRLGHHGGVGVPLLADDLLVAGLARDLDDLGVGLHALVVGMDEDLAEAAREGLVALGIELLVAEEDDAVVEQRLADVADGGLVEILR